MCKKVIFILLLACTCLLMSCSNRSDTLIANDIVSNFESLGNEQKEPDFKQTNNTNVLKKYSVDESGTITNFLDTLDTLYKSDKNYKIYTDGFSFRYEVNDNIGNVLDMGYHDYRGSFDLYHLGNLLVLDYGFGGNSGTSKRYYDVERGRISSFFLNPITVSDTRVAYFIQRENDGKNVLIVQDLFDSSKYYTTIERDFADSLALLYNSNAEFLDNSTKLQITYPFGVQEKGKPVQYKTEVLSLEK